MIKNHILYGSVIENDGRIGTQLTFLGAALGAVTVIAVLFFAVPFLASFL